MAGTRTDGAAEDTAGDPGAGAGTAEEEEMATGPFGWRSTDRPPGPSTGSSLRTSPPG